MSYLALAKKIQAELKSAPEPPAVDAPVDSTEGAIIAVLIDSPIVGPVWFARSDDFKSGDDIPIFFMSEIPHLEKMGPPELRRRYEDKLAVGGRIVSKQ